MAEGQEKVQKGRGFEPNHKREDFSSGALQVETDQGPGKQSSSKGPVRSVEGYILIVRGAHEEAEEDDIVDAFSDLAEVEVTNIHLNPDRQTGYGKGYALIEVETASDGDKCIKEMNGKKILDREIQVGWAFSNK
jgi:RNA-binding protein 8A